MTKREAIAICKAFHFSVEPKLAAMLGAIYPAAGNDYFFDRPSWGNPSVACVKEAQKAQQDVGKFFMAVAVALMSDEVEHK